MRFLLINLRPTDLIEVDHIVPRNEGGDKTCKNKQLLHRHCHDLKTPNDLEAVKH
ncbi:MAG: HNH endonuclease signature motif containing protein [Trichodesmium sp. St17_bin3_1_1]|nr:HNH endonuclease signature motif containing protein [Trichodesmium sp. St18_bin1]MDE5108843.1 HNH endonuclease signature motif containing protein [Trichodesmium sp. St17_bin3_1_1]